MLFMGVSISWGEAYWRFERVTVEGQLHERELSLASKVVIIWEIFNLNIKKNDDEDGELR